MPLECQNNEVMWHQCNILLFKIVHLSQFYLYSPFHNTHHPKAALEKMMMLILLMS